MSGGLMAVQRKRASVFVSQPGESTKIPLQAFLNVGITNSPALAECSIQVETYKIY